MFQRILSNLNSCSGLLLMTCNLTVVKMHGLSMAFWLTILPWIWSPAQPPQSAASFTDWWSLAIHAVPATLRASSSLLGKSGSTATRRSSTAYPLMCTACSALSERKLLRGLKPGGQASGRSFWLPMPCCSLFWRSDGCSKCLILQHTLLSYWRVETQSFYAFSTHKNWMPILEMQNKVKEIFYPVNSLGNL